MILQGAEVAKCVRHLPPWRWQMVGHSSLCTSVSWRRKLHLKGQNMYFTVFVLTNYDQIRTCFVYGGGVMPGWRPGSGVGKYNAESPKQGSKRFNSITKRIRFAHLGILFIFCLFVPPSTSKHLLTLQPKSTVNFFYFFTNFYSNKHRQKVLGKNRTHLSWSTDLKHIFKV